MPHAVSTAVSKIEVSDFHQVAPILIYTVSQKRLPFIFWITLKKLPILMISVREILRKFDTKILQIVHFACQM